MVFALLLIGLLAIISAVRGNVAQVATQLERDFTASGSGASFWSWIAAIVVFGLIGRVTGTTRAMRLFIVLLLAVYLISQRGIFAEFSRALATVQAPAPASPQAVGAQTDARGATAATEAPATTTAVPAAPAATGDAASAATPSNAAMTLLQTMGLGGLFQ